MPYRRYTTEPDRGQVTEPSVGTLIILDGTLHRLVAILDGRYLLATTTTHQIYLVQNDDGNVGLPARQHLEQMLTSGRAAKAGPECPRAPSSPFERMRAEIELLDAHHVANGSKAIWLFLHHHWTPELIARFGDYDEPATIKKWRTAARRVSR